MNREKESFTLCSERKKIMDDGLRSLDVLKKATAKKLVERNQELYTATKIIPHKFMAKR